MFETTSIIQLIKLYIKHFYILLKHNNNNNATHSSSSSLNLYIYIYFFHVIKQKLYKIPSIYTNIIK